MITASIVLYKTDVKQIETVIGCANRSCIERIYVIDNSPTCALQSMVLSLSEKIEYIFGQGNVGYGAGHNIGIKRAIEINSKYHVVLNPDIQFDEDVIVALEKFADAHEDVGMLMPNVKYPNGMQQFLCTKAGSDFGCAP